MGIKRKAREFALQILFQREFDKSKELRDIIAQFVQNFDVDTDVGKMGSKIVNGTMENLDEIDSKLSGVSRNWSTSRMAFVDLNILRIASFEILYLEADTPFKVAIDEAIELAKKYGSTESASFINGILDQLAKQKEA